MGRAGGKIMQLQFAEMVKEARKKVGLSQAKLGEKIGVWNTYVGQIEKGEKVPSDEKVVKLAEVLELNTDKVLLVAYQSRADSVKAKDLFFKMESALSDPVLQRLLSTGKPLDPGVLEALGDTDICEALRKEEWRRMFALCYKVGKNRDIPGLVALVSAMNDQQWSAMMNIIQAMGLELPD